MESNGPSGRVTKSGTIPGPVAPRSSGGDVDLNGDLVDELVRLIPAESPVSPRLQASLVAETLRARGIIR